MVDRCRWDISGAAPTPYLQVLAALHQILDVIDGGEEEVEDLEKVMFFFRETSVRQQLHQVTKVIATGQEVTSQTALTMSTNAMPTNLSLPFDNLTSDSNSNSH